MSIPLITWEAPEPLGPPQGMEEGTEENPLLQLSLQDMIQRDRESSKQQQQQQRRQHHQHHHHQQHQQQLLLQHDHQEQQQQNRRVLLLPSPSLIPPKKETWGRWHDLMRAVCVEALRVTDAGWSHVRFLSNAEHPVPSSLFVITGGVVTPQDLLAFFQPFNPVHVEFLSSPETEEASSGDPRVSGVQTCCVLFPSPAAAAAALQQRSSPCRLLLQRHKEQLQLRVQQLEELLEGEAEEGEVQTQQQQQQQQQQLETQKEQLFNLNRLEEDSNSDADIGMCINQLARWRRTVSVPTNSEGRSYQLLLRVTTALDLPAASAEAANDSSRLVQLKPGLNFTLAATAAAAAAAAAAAGGGGPAASLGRSSDIAGVEERALLQDSVTVQASKGQFRSMVLRGAVDLGEAPARPSCSRAKLTPRAEGHIMAVHEGGPAWERSPPEGEAFQPHLLRPVQGGGRRPHEAPVGCDDLQDRYFTRRSPEPIDWKTHREEATRGGPLEGLPLGAPREGPRIEEPLGGPLELSRWAPAHRRRSRSRSRSWGRDRYELRGRDRREKGSGRKKHARALTSTSRSRSSTTSRSSSTSSRERRRRHKRDRSVSRDRGQDKNRKGRGFKGGRRGMAADRELARKHRSRRRRRDSD